jgi:excisionase family DNA binding protein
MKGHPPGGTHISPSIGSPAITTEPDAVAIPVVCRVLGISRTKLYELLGSGVLPSVKIGRRRLVRLGTARDLLTTLERTGLDNTAATAPPVLRSRSSARTSTSLASQLVSVEHGTGSGEAK